MENRLTIRRGRLVVQWTSNYTTIGEELRLKRRISLSCGMWLVVLATKTLDLFSSHLLMVLKNLFQVVTFLYNYSVKLVAGIVLVHDLTNRKSEVNLRKWLAEVLTKECNSSMSGRNNPSRSHEIDEYDPEQFIGSSQVYLTLYTEFLVYNYNNNIFFYRFLFLL